jgi:hypothetical protein
LPVAKWARRQRSCRAPTEAHMLELLRTAALPSAASDIPLGALDAAL